MRSWDLDQCQHIYLVHAVTLRRLVFWTALISQHYWNKTQYVSEACVGSQPSIKTTGLLSQTMEGRH